MVCFYPTTPGREQQAWNEFPQAFRLFIKGEYAGQFEKKLLDEFNKSLLATPPWERPNYDHKSSYLEKQQIRLSLYQSFNPEGRLLVL